MVCAEKELSDCKEQRKILGDFSGGVTSRRPAELAVRVMSTKRKKNKILGDLSGGAIPDPIPNSEVKPSSADGTAWETVWESRSPPLYRYAPISLPGRGVFCFYRFAIADRSFLHYFY